MESSQVLHEWERAAALLFPNELKDAFGGSDTRKAVEDVVGGDFDQAVKNHNPIYYLILSCWFDNDPDLLYPPAHRDILCRDLATFYQEDLSLFSGYIVLWPKNLFKTTIGLAFVQFFLMRQRLILDKDPRVVIEHHKEEYAFRNLGKLKEKFHAHAWMAKRFPEFCFKKKFGLVGQFDLKNRKNQDKGSSGSIEPSCYACSVGTVVAGWKFDLRFCDDIVTEDHAKSATLRSDLVQRYEVGRNMLDVGKSKELIMGHRWHVEDHYGTCVNAVRPNGNRMYASSIRPLLNDEETETLCPNRYSVATAKQLREDEILRTGSDYNYWAVRQNNPKRAAKVIFDPNWYAWFGKNDPNWDKFIAKTMKVIIMDTAHKDEDTRGGGDKTVIQCWAFDWIDGLIHKYILDHDQSVFWDVFNAGREAGLMAKKWRTDLVFAEEIGQKSSLLVMDREARKIGFTGGFMRVRGTKRTKKDRTRALFGEYRAGRIHVYDKLPFLEEFKTSHENWTEGTKHGDDEVDCAAHTCDEAVVEKLGLMDWKEETPLSDLYFPENTNNQSRYSPV